MQPVLRVLAMQALVPSASSDPGTGPLQGVVSAGRDREPTERLSEVGKVRRSSSPVHLVLSELCGAEEGRGKTQIGVGGSRG